MADVYDDSDLMVEIDATDIDEDSLHSGGGVDKEGYYHVECLDIGLTEGESDKLRNLKIDLVVLDGEHSEQSGRKIFHRLYLEGWENKSTRDKRELKKEEEKRILAFSFAFGLITADQLGQEKLKIPFHLIRMRQAVVKVTKADDYEVTDSMGSKVKKTGGYKIAWSNEAWPVDHPRVADVPKDANSLSEYGTSGLSGASEPSVDVSDL